MLTLRFLPELRQEMSLRLAHTCSVCRQSEPASVDASKLDRSSVHTIVRLGYCPSCRASLGKGADLERIERVAVYVLGGGGSSHRPLYRQGIVGTIPASPAPRSDTLFL